MQVAGQRYARRGGPREAPVLARLAGPGSPSDQLIFINDRGAVAAFGAMLGNAGAAILFASVVAGLTISFPCIWPIGAVVYMLVVSLGAGRIVALGTIDLWQTRVIQEWMFEQLPPDGTQEKAGGRVIAILNYRKDALELKPDLSESVFDAHPLMRPLRLYRYIGSTLRRETRIRAEAFVKAKAGVAKTRG
jgi:hypothetical protein